MKQYFICVGGTVNMHNSRVWGSENPHACYWTRVWFTEGHRVVCCGEEVIRPFIFVEPTVIGDTFGYDGEHCLASCPSENSFPFTWCSTSLLPSCLCLSGWEFPDRWIGRGGLVSWPPYFPNLSSPDFFWGLVKYIVYRDIVKVANVFGLLDRIVRAVECVTNEMLASTWRETKCRFDVCLATDGAHIEIYW